MKIFLILCLCVSSLPISTFTGSMIAAGGALKHLAANRPQHSYQSFFKDADNVNRKQIPENSPVVHQGIDKSIRSFAKPNKILYPTSIHLSSMNDYTITGFVGRGADGSVFEGHDPANPEEKLIFKLYIGGFYSFLGYEAIQSIFLTEVWALEIQNRLIDADYRNLVTVQPKIEGINLQNHLSNLQYTDENQYNETIKEYLALPEKFRKQWNFIHGDVRPSNVIIDKSGKMNLIDFCRSRPISSDKTRRAYEELVDDDLARKAINHKYEWSDFSSFYSFLKDKN
jgi:serine/threonine protein kinase